MSRDQHQQFVAISISRETVAVELNHVLGREEFAYDDDRLTDEFCTEFALQYGELTSDMSVECDETGDGWHAFGLEYATKLGVSA